MGLLRSSAVPRFVASAEGSELFRVFDVDHAAIPLHDVDRTVEAWWAARFGRRAVLGAAATPDNQQWDWSYDLRKLRLTNS